MPTAISKLNLLALRNEVMALMPKDPVLSIILLSNSLFMDILNGLDPSCAARFRSTAVANAMARDAKLLIGFVKEM